jgi:hypothetical protein
MSEVKKTIRVKRRVTAQEDFAPNEQVQSEEIHEKYHGFENLTVLDLFALMALPATARKLDNPAQAAKEAYAVGREMLAIHEANR